MPAVRKPTIHSAGKRSKVLPRISSLLKKPARGGIPAMARVAIKNVRAVAGILPHSAPILRMSCSPESAWITLPEPRKRSALKNAWVIRWKIPAAKAPTRSEEHTSELQSRPHLVCRLLLEKKKHTGRNCLRYYRTSLGGCNSQKYCGEASEESLC